MRTRLAIIMVADIVGYTSIMARDEQAGIAAVRDVNDNFLEPETNRQGGEILKRLGDGWIVAFGSIQAGMTFATRLLEAMAPHPKVKIRIGSHFGDIMEDEADFYGAGVNMAARLQSEAPPAGMMVSGDLFRQFTGKLAQQFESAGNFQLKNIPYPVEGYQWRPQKRRAAGRQGEVPTVLVEKFEYAPLGPEAQSHTRELRDQVLMILSRRTGIRTVDAEDDIEVKPDYRLRGRFRMSGTRARMTVSMVLCETSEPVFSRNYEGDLSDIFDFADKITAQVNSDMRIQINAYDAVRSKDLPEDELSVSELRSRAAHEFYKGAYESWRKGEALLERALTLNPADPMALGMRGMARSALAAARFEPLAEAEAQSLLDDLDAAVSEYRQSDFLFAARAHVQAFALRDSQAAIRDGRQSLKINPHYLTGSLSLSLGHMVGGDFDAAIDVLNRSLELGTQDPLEPMRIFPLAVCHYCKGEYQLSAEVLERLIHQSAANWAVYKLRAMALENAGDTAGAERCRAQSERLPRTPSVVTFQAPLPEDWEPLIEALRPELDD